MDPEIVHRKPKTAVASFPKTLYKPRHPLSPQALKPKPRVPLLPAAKATAPTVDPEIASAATLPVAGLPRLG